MPFKIAQRLPKVAKMYQKQFYLTIKVLQNGPKVTVMTAHQAEAGMLENPVSSSSFSTK